MPDGTNNIYLDSTFTSADEGYTVVDSSVEFVDPMTNIGDYNIPVIYQTTTSAIAVMDFDVEYFVNTVSISGTDNVPLSFFREISSDFGVVPSLIEYSIDNVISGTLSSYIKYSTGYSAISGTVDEWVTFIAGEHYEVFKSYLMEHRYDPAISGSNSYWQNYMNFSGHVNPSGLPIPALGLQKDIITEYGVSVQNSGGFNPYVDVTFAGWVDFIFPTDIFAVDMNVNGPYPFDVETISGGVLPNYLDVYSAQLTMSGIDFDVYCSLLSMGIVNADIELANGRIVYIRGEVYSTAVNTPTIVCDIDLYSIKITNFSLDIGEYTTASGYISVDVLDDVYGISTSGTYFKADNEIVSVTFSSIENGYRMFYDPEDDFSSLNGPTIFTARAENNNGDILEEDYYLTFGYLVEYENYPRIGMDYDYNTKVTVRVTAENYASCPKLSSDGHRFVTEQRKNVDLGASIVGMFHADDVSNLSAEIHPVSTAYFYGKTFEVVIEAKDFAGNITKPFVLTYKIEDKPG